MNMLPSVDCNLNFNKTIMRWDEAIPLGNGLCGALIWGRSNALRFSLDRGDIWDTTPFAGVEREEFTYANMVKLAKEGDIDTIRRIFDAPYNHPLPSKLPAGKLIFDLGCDLNVCSSLDLADATTTVSVGNIELKSFIHATNRCGFISVDKPLSSFTFSIENPEYSIKTDWASNDVIVNSVNTSSLKTLHYPEPELVDEDGSCYFIQQISDDFFYGLFVKSAEINGNAVLCFYVASSNDGEDWKDQALKLLDQALDTGWEESLRQHSRWWANYWEKSGLSLPDMLFEKNWYITNYLLASCSRQGCYPMPLQGVWTADDGALPPWKGDYHHDLNTQMSYYSYLKANHIGEGQSFIDYLWNMADCGRCFAKSYYSGTGLCMPSTTSLNGAPLGGWGMYSLSPTNQLWLCQAFERHYRFTGDIQFLQEIAYPYLSESATFIESILIEKDGLLYLPVSSSPEIHDDLIESFVTPNSNYDLSLMHYLFTTLMNLAKELHNGEAGKWKAILNKLPDLALTPTGVLMVSSEESLNESHRHFSHAMAIHPLRLISYEDKENRRIIDATILDLERLGTGYWVGFSFTWMAELYAIQKNGNGAAYQLEVFWRNHCSQNGFHLNGDYNKRGTSTFHYRPFTLEANMCGADALQEMLLQTENNTLEFFPAIPDEWKEESLSFHGFRGEKGLLISAAMEGGMVTSFSLRTEYPCKLTIINFTSLQHLSCNIPLEIHSHGDDSLLILEGGKEYSFT